MTDQRCFTSAIARRADHWGIGLLLTHNSFLNNNFINKLRRQLQP
jgi:hypothetical protein